MAVLFLTDADVYQEKDLVKEACRYSVYLMCGIPNDFMPLDARSYRYLPAYEIFNDLQNEILDKLGRERL